MKLIVLKDVNENDIQNRKEQCIWHTHGDNKVMQSLLKKCGFTHCGTIYVEEDDYPRLAFEKVSKNEE